MIQGDISGIRPASEAFREGKLEMASNLAPGTSGAAGWSLDIFTTVVMAIFLILTIITISDFIRMLPLLVDSYSRKSSCLAIEHSVQTSGQRNFTAFIILLPFCLVADKFDLFRPNFLSGVPHGWMAVVLIGVFILYILVKLLMANIVRKPYHISFDSWRAIQRCFFNYFILMAVVVMATAGLMSLFGAETGGVQKVCRWEIAGIYFLSFLRSGNILSDYCSGLGTILYLCALEVLPTGALVACAIWL